MTLLSCFTVLLVTMRMHCLFDLLRQLWWVVVMLVIVAVTGIWIFSILVAARSVLLLNLISIFVVLVCTRRRVDRHAVIFLIRIGMLSLQTNRPRPNGLNRVSMRLVSMAALWTMNTLMLVVMMLRTKLRAPRGDRVVVMATRVLCTRRMWVVTSLGPTGLVHKCRNNGIVLRCGIDWTRLKVDDGLLHWAYNFLRPSIVRLLVPFTATVAVGDMTELTGVVMTGTLKVQVLTR